MSEQKVVSASGEIKANAKVVFELIADPARQPEWDGNDNLQSAEPDQRVTAVGQSFVMTNTNGKQRANRVVDFREGRVIAWRPNPIDETAGEPGHEWRWEVEPIAGKKCRVTHTYDWTDLTDESRLERARNTTEDKLQASIDRLKALAESI